MQDKIRNIIIGNLPHEEKISALRQMFSSQDDVVFSDLDDTMTSYTSLLYSRVHLMKKMFPGITPEQMLRRALPYMGLQKRFLEIARVRKIKKIIILSRNDYLFLEVLLPHLQARFAHFGVEIIGIVGALSHRFPFSSTDKISLMSGEKLLISDVFEKRALTPYPYFLLTEDMSLLEKKFLQFRKTLHLISFFFSLLFRGKTLSHSS